MVNEYVMRDIKYRMMLSSWNYYVDFAWPKIYGTVKFYLSEALYTSEAWNWKCSKTVPF